MMSPNDRWDDFAIDNFVEMVKNYMEATAALPNQMAKLHSQLERLSAELKLSDQQTMQRLDSHHKWIEAIDARCKAQVDDVKELVERVGAELRNDAKERIRNRYSLVIAIIGAASIVAAAIITAPH